MPTSRHRAETVAERKETSAAVDRWRWRRKDVEEALGEGWEVICRTDALLSWVRVALARVSYCLAIGLSDLDGIPSRNIGPLRHSRSTTVVGCTTWADTNTL